MFNHTTQRTHRATALLKKKAINDDHVPIQGLRHGHLQGGTFLRSEQFGPDAFFQRHSRIQMWVD